MTSPPRAASGPRRIAIVGNAPFEEDLSEAIDAAEIVVRFNNAYGYGGARGSKIDDLFLVNCGGQPLEWLQSAEFWRRDYLRRAPKITLPFKAESLARQLPHSAQEGKSIDRVNFEHDLRRAFAQIGKPVLTLSPALRRAAQSALRETGATSESATPSTGFLAIFAYLAAQRGDIRIDLYGFGFEGWRGHDWASERRWIRAREAQGQLVWRRPSQL